jgi:hypothetical protein
MAEQRKVELSQVGPNIHAGIDETNILHIKVDLNKNVGPSASGKNMLICKCPGGKVVLDNGMTLNMSVYKKI